MYVFFKLYSCTSISATEPLKISFIRMFLMVQCTCNLCPLQRRAVNAVLFLIENTKGATSIAVLYEKDQSEHCYCLNWLPCNHITKNDVKNIDLLFSVEEIHLYFALLSVFNKLPCGKSCVLACTKDKQTKKKKKEKHCKGFWFDHS